jgi:hypothetical protein
MATHIIARFEFRNNTNTGAAHQMSERYSVVRAGHGRVVILTPYGRIPLRVFLRERKSGLIVGRVLRSMAQPDVKALNASVIEVTEQRNSVTGRPVLRVFGGELNGQEF